MTRLRRLWERWFGEALRKVEAESLAYRVSPDGRRPDCKAAAVLLTVAACLTLQNYLPAPDRVAPVAGFVATAVGGPDARTAVEARLAAWTADPPSRLTWTAAVAVFVYAAIPVLVIRFGFRERLREYGTACRGGGADWPVYAGIALVMAPLVWAFSAEERFQHVYPMYRVGSAADLGPGFVRWEVLYALQFAALEFFFRGFLLHGTRHRFGVYAVFVMTVPYAMIHYQKPMPEAFGSIAAGVALGMLSLATRSIWPGAALHVTVAWGMDLACLARRGVLG